MSISGGGKRPREGAIKMATKFCPHCPATEAEGHREYCMKFTGELEKLEGELEGFKTFKEFSRHLCMQIIGLGQDIARQDPETFGKRLFSLQEASQYFLIMYGTGEPGPAVSGILTERDILAKRPAMHVPITGLDKPPPGPCSVCKAIAAINCSIEGCPHRPASSEKPPTFKLTYEAAKKIAIGPVEHGDVVLIDGEARTIEIEPAPHEPPADYGEDGLAGCPVCKTLVCMYEPAEARDRSRDLIKPPKPKLRTCNMHNDCDAADERAKAAGRRRLDHCHDEDCEDCFGK